MSESYIFVWISWILWVSIVFFLPRTRMRTILSIWLLLIIISSTTIISIQNSLLTTVACVVVLLGGMICLSLHPKWILTTFKILTLVFANVTLLMMMKVSPVIIFVPESILVLCLNIMLVMLLTDEYKTRLIIVIISVSLSELIYGLILNQLYIVYISGNYLALSRLQVVIIVLSIIHLMNQWRKHALFKANLYKSPKFKQISFLSLILMSIIVNHR